MATVDLPLDNPAKKSLAQARTAAPHVIAVTSGKGGVGKSSISVNLGIALSRMGRKVCLFDADTGLANINILLGLTPKLSLEHVLFGNKSIADVMLEGPHGLKVIPGANGIVECVSLQPRQHMQLTRQLADIEGEYDYLLVDTAAGIGDDTMDFVSAAQQTIIVVTTEPTSLTDAFSLLKLLRRRGKKSHFHVIVNMCSSTKQAREVFHRFSGAVEKYIGIKLNYLGFILQDESLRAAVTMQSPVALFPETDPSCKNFFRLGRALEDTLELVTPKASFSTYWHTRYRQQRPARISAATTGNNKRPAGPANTKNRPAASQGQQESLGKLRTRLLTLIAQGDIPAPALTALLDELGKAVRRMYPEIRTPPTAVQSSPERVNSPERMNSPERINSPERMDSPEHTVSPEHMNSPERTDSPERMNSPERTDSPPPANTFAPPQHQYDVTRFGSQQLLLQTLRQHTDKPLIQLLDSLDGRPS